MFCKFLKASALELFSPMHSWDSELPNFFLWKFVLLTCALFQLSNLLKANRTFSANLFVPFQFKWRPLLLQSYFELIFELLIKQIFLLWHSLLRSLFTSITFALSHHYYSWYCYHCWPCITVTYNWLYLSRTARFYDFPNTFGIVHIHVITFLAILDTPFPM